MTNSTTDAYSLRTATLRVLLVLAVALGGLGGLAASAQAKLVTDPATGKRLGIVPKGSTRAPKSLSSHARRTDCLNGDCSALQYHSGPVQHAQQDYLFFWDPSGALPPLYKAGLGQWLTDLAGANNSITPISVTQQYYDNSGAGGSQSFARLAVQNAGSITDTTPYVSDCPTSLSYPTCITDGQIASELQQYISAHGLPTGDNVQYFVLTPQGVDICGDSGGGQCASNTFCGYHSNSPTSGAEPQLIYAVLPWTYSDVSNGCDSGTPHLNPNQIDSVVDTFSHELSETITDPTGGGWYDSSGNEIADKCVGIYGNTLSASNSALYNTQLGNDRYLIQTEFSNQTSNCEQGESVPLNVAVPRISGPAGQGQILSETNGSWSNGPTSFTYQWEDCDGSGNNCSPIAGATGQSYQLGPGDVGHTIRVSEVAVNGTGAGGAALSAQTAVVLPLPPVNAGAPGISGTARLGQTLTGTRGVWVNNPTALADQWQRCNAAGAACTPIAGAGGQAYMLTGADIGHTIRVTETATNASGSATATSGATAIVGPTSAQIKKLLVPLATTRWRPRLTHLFRTGGSTYFFRAPTPGLLQIVVRRGGTVVARGSFRFPAARNAGIVVKLTPKGRKLRRRRPGKLQLTVTFVPRGGSGTTLSRRFAL